MGKLGLADDICLQQLLIEKCSFTEDVQRTPLIFPGFVTIYKIHKLIVRLQDKCDPGLACIGLPHGYEFDASCPSCMGNSYTSFFTWAPHEEFEKSVLRWYGNEQLRGNEYVKCKFATDSDGKST